MGFKTTILAAAAVMAMGGAASAATIMNGGNIAVGDNGLGNGVTGPGGSVTFTYTATADLRVLDFLSLASVGFSSGSDLVEMSFGYTSPTLADISDTYDASEITVSGATAEAATSIPGFVLLAGESFTLFFNQTASSTGDVTNGYSFATAAVPLPAGLLLLGTALGGLGVASRRKNKAKAAA